MKKLIQKYIFIFLIGVFFISITPGLVQAKGIVELGQSDSIKSIFSLSSSGGDLLSSILRFAQQVINFIRLLLNGVALLAMLYVGFLWVTSMGDEEKTSDGKNRIILVVLGLFLINIPEVLYRIFTGSDYRVDGFGKKIGDVSGQLSGGGSMGSISASGTNKCNFLFCPESFWGTNINAIIPVLETTMLVVAVIMFTIGGFQMMLGGSESSSDTAKKRLGYGVIALLITGFIEMIYRAVFFQPSLNGVATKVTSTLVQVAKFFIYLAGPIAIIYIIIGGYYYITSGGDEERADKGKKILMYTFFATIMLLLGYTFLIEIVGLNLF